VSPYARSLSDLKDELKDAGKDLNKVHEVIEDLQKTKHRIEVDPALSHELKQLLLTDLQKAQTEADRQQIKVKVALVPVWERAGRTVWDNIGLTAPGRPLWDLQGSGDAALGDALGPVLFPSAYGNRSQGKRAQINNNLQSGSDFYRKEIARANRERNAYGPSSLSEEMRRARLENAARYTNETGQIQRDHWGKGLAENEAKKTAQLAAQEAKNEEARKANEKAAREREKREREALQEHFRKQRNELQQASQAWREYGQTVESVADKLIGKLGNTRDSVVDLIQGFETKLLESGAGKGALSTFYGMAAELKKDMKDGALLGGIYDKSRATSEAAEKKARRLDTLRDNVGSSGKDTGKDTGIAITEEVLKGVKTQKGISNCANVAGQILQQIGVAIKRDKFAANLARNAEAMGAKRISVDEASAGDLIVWYDPAKYGAKQKNGKRSGYHTAVAAGNGRYIGNRGGEDYSIKEGKIYDRAHAYAYDTSVMARGGSAGPVSKPVAAAPKGKVELPPDYEAIRKMAERPEFKAAYTKFSSASLQDLFKLHPKATEENEERRKALLALPKLTQGMHEWAASLGLADKEAQNWVKETRAAIYAMGNFADWQSNATRRGDEALKKVREGMQNSFEGMQKSFADAPLTFDQNALRNFGLKHRSRLANQGFIEGQTPLVSLENSPYFGASDLGLSEKKPKGIRYPGMDDYKRPPKINLGLPGISFGMGSGMSSGMGVFDQRRYLESVEAGMANDQMRLKNAKSEVAKALGGFSEAFREGERGLNAISDYAAHMNDEFKALNSNLDIHIESLKFAPGKARDAFLLWEDLKANPKLSDAERTGLFNKNQQFTEAQETQRIWEDVFSSISDGALNMQGGVSGALKSIKQDLESMALDFAKQQLFDLLLGLVGGNKKPKFTGGIGGNIGVPGPQSNPHYNGLPGVPARANGGPVDANQMYLVGERGPELFMSRDAGRIVPNHDLQMMRALNNRPSRTYNGGNVTVNNNVTVNVSGGNQNAEQIGREVARQISGSRPSQREIARRYAGMVRDGNDDF
ncbi:MAG TPA: hypothetical protein VGB77_01475, partial [Abditibacteriaceae bacterium]